MAKLKEKISHGALMELKIVPWTSWKTTKRKIKADGFPHYFDGGRYSFVAEEVEMWWKRRQNAAA